MCLANLVAMSQVCKGYIMLVKQTLIILLFKDTDLKDQVDNSKYFESLEQGDFLLKTGLVRQEISSDPAPVRVK